MPPADSRNRDPSDSDPLRDPRGRQPHHSLHPISPEDQQPVPVYDCRVYVGSPDASGRVTARVATLADVSAEGRSEREALQRIVRIFKMTIAGYRERGEPIPWLDPPLEPAVGEQTRWLAVHL